MSYPFVTQSKSRKEIIKQSQQWVIMQSNVATRSPQTTPPNIQGNKQKPIKLM